MKKLFSICAAALLLLSACDNASKQTEEIAPDKIYFFFSNTCPHCHHALEYINAKYPNLEMAMVNVGNPEGLRMLAQAAKDFEMGDSVGTPLMVCGDNYLMGWSVEYEPRFDEYVRPYLK